MIKFILFFLPPVFISLTLYCQGCLTPSTGLIPINDLGTGIYSGLMGGLYPGGSNYRPTAHKIAGLQKAAQVQCLNSNGIPDPFNGKIGWLSIGMSNTTQETQKFIPIANAYTGKNPKLTLVDGAQGGMTAQIISSPWHANYSLYWSTVVTRLVTAGITPQQVQIIWLKSADQAASMPVWTHHDSLVVRYKRIMYELKTRFPNVKICYLSSRISARYATSPLNPEPYSYITGWAVKKVIELQITGDPQLQHSGIGANSPWISWGSYMWSDGSTPQLSNPSVFWDCSSDFNTTDYTHPSPVGATKAANLWLQFHISDSTSKPWFLGLGCIQSATLGVKIFITGFYSGNGLMQAALFNQGETGSSPQQCDSVSIELRTSEWPYTLVALEKTLLALNGTCTVIFPFTGVYYIVVKHRNGLETWSEQPLLCYGNTNYNFSNAASKAYGANQVLIDNGVFGIFSGDIHQDGSIDALDYLLLDTDLVAGNSGYLSSDLNGDGAVDALDYLLLDPNVTTGVGIISP